MDTSRRRAGPYVIEARHHRPADAEAEVVLVHAMVVAGRGTEPLARALAARRLAVHVPDQPGFGRSDKPARALDVAGLATVLGRWMEAAGLRSVPVLGNSFGTQVAAALAVARPELVSRLALVSPTIDARYRRGWTALLGRPRPSPLPPPSSGRLAAAQLALRDRLVPAGDAPPASLRSLLVHEYLAAGPLRALSTYRHALRDDLVDRLGSLAVPLLVVRTGDDGVVSPAWARAVAAAGHGRLVEVPGIGHDAQFDHPEVLADAVAGWLSGRPAAQPTPTPSAEPSSSAAEASSSTAMGGGSGHRGRARRRASR